MIEYRNINLEEMNRELFADFQRRQDVTKCWRKVEGEWVIRDIAFVDDWSAEDYEFLVKCLHNTIQTGGVVIGAFCEGHLKGFASVEAELFGSDGQYMDLTSLHVSGDMRRNGMGAELLNRAKAFAGEHGAKKLYISAHSAVESQAFYRAMGCVEAEEYNKAHVEAEPCDCQLEVACAGE